jgi:hypothetical protein
LEKSHLSTRKKEEKGKTWTIFKTLHLQDAYCDGTSTAMSAGNSLLPGGLEHRLSASTVLIGKVGTRGFGF